MDINHTEQKPCLMDKPMQLNPFKKRGRAQIMMS